MKSLTDHARFLRRWTDRDIAQKVALAAFILDPRNRERLGAFPRHARRTIVEGALEFLREQVPEDRGFARLEYDLQAYLTRQVSSFIRQAEKASAK